MRPAALVVLFGFALVPAWSQPARLPTESVTVTGTRYSHEAIKGFVAANTVPTRMAGKITRWKDPVCPQILGLPSKFAQFIAGRIKTVAAKVGAPVTDRRNCKTNIHVVFTTRPQDLLDNILKTGPDYLGTHDTIEQGRQMSRITRPVQSWYLTSTVDLRGNVFVDSPNSGGLTIYLPDPNRVPPFVEAYIPRAKSMSVTGNRLGDGLSSALYHVLVVAEPGKLLNDEIGTLADYIAMLVLSQQSAPQQSGMEQGGCQALDSILNLLEAQCPHPAALSDGDIAYLAALYRMGAADNLAQQRDELVFLLEKSVGKPSQ